VACWSIFVQENRSAIELAWEHGGADYILPLPCGIGRVRCRQIYEATCQDCFESCLAGQSEEEQRAILESMMAMADDDVMLQWRVSERLRQFG
jgi:hypothetical protein